MEQLVIAHKKLRRRRGYWQLPTSVSLPMRPKSSRSRWIGGMSSDG
jgi:hypothetical protein